jgi:hypothetical protein
MKIYKASKSATAFTADTDFSNHDLAYEGTGSTEGDFAGHFYVYADPLLVGTYNFYL